MTAQTCPSSLDGIAPFLHQIATVLVENILLPQTQLGPKCRTEGEKLSSLTVSSRAIHYNR